MIKRTDISKYPKQGYIPINMEGKHLRLTMGNKI
jgi:hypothetical protein